MTSVGELFVSLGVKGTDKTVGALKGVKTGLSDIRSESLAAKAAIVGAVYGLERLFAASGKRGNELENYAALLGLSTQTLQKYEYAARQVGATNEDVASSFAGIQDAMGKIQRNEGAPVGLKFFAEKMGTSEADVAEFMKTPELLIQKMQDYFQKESNIPLRNMVAKSFGMTEGMISAIAQKAFNPAALNRAPTYSDTEIARLQKADAAWGNISEKFKMMAGHFNAKYGEKFTNDISKLIGPIEKVVEALVRFADKTKMFDGLQKVFEAVAVAIDKIADGLLKLEKSKAFKNFVMNVGDAAKYFGETGGDTKRIGSDLDYAARKKFGDKPVAAAENTFDFFAQALESLVDVIFRGQIIPGQDKLGKQSVGKPGTPTQGNPTPKKSNISAPPIPSQGSIASPAAPTVANAANTQNININQSLNFQNDGSNAQQAASDHGRAIQQAARQIPVGGY